MSNLTVKEYKRAAQLLQSVAHPTRLRIIAELAGARIPLSPVMLTARLNDGIPLGDVAYHVRTMLAAGVIYEHESKQRGGATEHMYRLTDDGKMIAGPAKSLLAATARRLVRVGR